MKTTHPSAAFPRTARESHTSVMAVKNPEKYTPAAVESKRLFPLIRRPLRGNALGIEVALKIRHHRRQFRRRLHQPITRVGSKHFLHLLKVIHIISAQIYHAARRQDLVREPGKLFVHEAKFAMPLLRPWIRKINMQSLRRVRRQQILQQVRTLDANTPHVRQSKPPPFAIHFLQPPQQPFHSEKVYLRTLLRPGNEKRRIATTKFHLQRLRSRKQLGQVQSFQNGRQCVNQIGSRG
jgi:hypothetical protein